MSKARVYVAGASRELDRVKAMVAKLEASGLVEITSRWFDAVEAWGVGRDAELTDDQARGHALADLQGVSEAELIWFLWPQNHSAGAFVEFGYALSLKNNTVLVSGEHSACIFTRLADFRSTTDENALELVLNLAAGLCS